MNCLSCGELWPLLDSYFCPEETYLHSPHPLYSGGTRFQAGAVSALFVFLPSIRSPAGTSLPVFGLVLAEAQAAAASVATDWPRPRGRLCRARPTQRAAPTRGRRA